MTGDGSTATLTLSITPISENATFVTIDGVMQHKDTYSISGTTLTFSAAPPNGSSVEVATLGSTTINEATIVQDADSDTRIQVEESADEDIIRFDTAGTERMVINSSGNVGINTSSPSQLLHLGGATNKGIQITTSTSNAGYLAVYQDENIFGVNRNPSDGSFADTGKTAQFISLQSQNGDGWIKFATTVTNNTEPSETMRLDGNGRVSVDKSAYIKQGALTSSSNSVAWDSRAIANAYYATTENTTFAAPTNPVEGAIISVEIAQGATPYTVAWNTVFEFAASTAPTVTATANKTDIFSFRYNGSVWQEIGRTQNLAQT